MQTEGRLGRASIHPPPSSPQVSAAVDIATKLYASSTKELGDQVRVWRGRGRAGLQGRARWRGEATASQVWGRAGVPRPLVPRPPRSPRPGGWASTHAALVAVPRPPRASKAGDPAAQHPPRERARVERLALTGGVRGERAA